MPDVTPQPTATPAPAAGAPPVSAPEAPKSAAELITRVATAAAAPAPAAPAEAPVVPITLDEIKDPAVRAVVEKKLKDLESGYNKKYMTLAEEKKATEDLRKKLEADTNQSWTPQRLQEMLQRPDFAQAVQTAYAAQAQQTPPSNWEGSTEQWSNLSDSDKHAFRQLEGKVNILLNQQEQTQHATEHERVKSRFPDYDPVVVEKFYQEANTGRVSSEQVKEMIWKALNFEKYVQNSYQFGLTDRNGNIQEKVGGTTNPTNPKMTSVGDMPTRTDGEGTASFVSRLARWNLSRKKVGA